MSETLAPFAQATHIEVEAAPRYWEDTEVNGVFDEDGNLIFGRAGDLWKIRVDLAAGKVENWPSDQTAAIHYKVCDAGEYWLSDAEGRRLAKWKGHYVPDDFLCHGEEGFGDYIILNVAADGLIQNYRRPAINPDRWNIL